MIKRTVSRSAAFSCVRRPNVWPDGVKRDSVPFRPVVFD
ncbi:hypothetical protein [Klebsiella phage vB_KpnS-MUC-5]|nr:hypothetical protein [Klebsiella phage vB_KpnS-MUC-5]